MTVRDALGDLCLFLFLTAVACVLAVASLYCDHKRPKALTFRDSRSQVANAAVLIMNRAETQGGTGVVFHSSLSESEILTNAHVCEVAKGGGVVQAGPERYQVVSYRESTESDLCMLLIRGDLGINTEIAKQAPSSYEEVLVAGHPDLLPTVVTEGHFSGRRIISIMTGMQPCTPEDLKDDNLIQCVTFGGIPRLRSFDAVLVTATIMPGSSGSGVYNARHKLVGLVFAGHQGLGYAWTVPYEQVLHFTTVEAGKLSPVFPSQDVTHSVARSQSLSSREIRQRCLLTKDDRVDSICKLFERDAVWRK